MAEFIGDAFQLAIMWAVMYGLLAFGWVHLRRVYKVEGGLIFGTMYYLYTVVAAAGLAYLFVSLGARALGYDITLIKPVEDLIWNMTSLISLLGVFAVAVGIILFIIRFIQSRRHRDDSDQPPVSVVKSSSRPAKRRSSKA